MQLNNVFKDWLSRRKITGEVIESFGLTVGNNPSFGECLIIPIVDRYGNFLFNKYRRNPLDESKPKYLYDKGSKVELYGKFEVCVAVFDRPLSMGQQYPTLLITEGEMDCLVAWSFNIPAVSSTGGAMSFQEEWAEYFKSFQDVIVCFDNDPAGADGMVKVLKYVPHAKVLFLPDRGGIKDISDYAMSGGDLNELIKTAIHFDGIESVKQNRTERIALWQNTYFHDAYIKEHSKPLKIPYIRDESIKDEVMRAKQYPISELLQLSGNKCRCIWHNEKTPSLCYFEKTNSVYCFGCGKFGDAIDVYRHLYKVSFKEAVKKLQ